MKEFPEKKIVQLTVTLEANDAEMFAAITVMAGEVKEDREPPIVMAPSGHFQPRIRREEYMGHSIEGLIRDASAVFCAELQSALRTFGLAPVGTLARSRYEQARNATREGAK